MATERATFAAGCFWGVQAAFDEVKGVVGTSVGYTGGRMREPTYEKVCGGDTGHAEAVEVEFDPAQVSYERLLDVFWDVHDPTQLNRQGPDVGEQYRSAIFYHTDTQKQAAQEAKQALEKARRFGRPIVTQIVPAADYWRAEDYHQHYEKKHRRGWFR